MNEASMKYIIARLVSRAIEARNEARQSPKDLFLQGRHIAYYEMLDILQTELDVHEVDPREFGLTIDPDSLL